MLKSLIHLKALDVSDEVHVMSVTVLKSDPVPTGNAEAPKIAGLLPCVPLVPGKGVQAI